MLTLRSDNRSLASNTKFAYLIYNYTANSASIEVSNIEPFQVGTPILFGEVGQADAEILKVLSISGSVITLGDENNVATSTIHSHSESTKISALQFDQIRFFWTAATGTIADENPTFDSSNPLSGWVSLDPSSYYSTFSDTSHTSGFGWFQYREAITLETSLVSNPIPYAGFSLNTVQQVFSDFDSSMSTNELKLVSMADKFSWFNEALTVLQNKLNLTNNEFNVSAPLTISVVAGTAEYMLQDDFSDIVEIVDAYGNEIPFIPVSQVLSNNGNNPSTVRHYLRGRYIGFSPTPTLAVSYTYTYRAKAARITNLSAVISLPDNAFYSLKDFMLYKAYLKFGNPLAATYAQSFKSSTDLYMQSSVKRNSNLDTWDIAVSSNT